jgi:protein TonB
MLDDFCPSKVTTDARKRFRGSIALAALVYGTAAAAIVGATATAHKVMEEELTQVEFAPPPEPEPPPPPVVEAAPPPPSGRPKVKRQEIPPPDEIPDEKPEESDQDLAETSEGGPQDGFLDGVEGGTGTAAAPPPPPPPPPPPAPVKIEPLIPPVNSPGNDRPKYSAGARRKGIEGTVVVSFDVLEDGRVANPRIESGPEELRENVLEAALGWRFKPAHRGGKPVKYRMTKSVLFRLDDE